MESSAQEYDQVGGVAIYWREQVHTSQDFFLLFTNIKGPTQILLSTQWYISYMYYQTMKGKPEKAESDLEGRILKIVLTHK